MMKIIFTAFIFFGFTYCFAQKGRMDYLYKGRCKESHPGFAAIAVFENQSCRPAPMDSKSDSGYWQSRLDNAAVCISRYRIIRVLDSAADTLKKEYLEVKERPVLPHFRHRPILIFGNYKNGMLQIEKYEEMKEYFEGSNTLKDMLQSSNFKLRLITEYAGLSTDLHEHDFYAFHSIGTPYYDVNAQDDIDKLYYNNYLVPNMKRSVESVGNDFSKLWQRITQKRTKVKASEITNDFAALVAINSMRPAVDPKRAGACSLEVAIETVTKNKANISAGISIYKDGGCPPLIDMFRPLYLFGDLQGDGLVVKSLVPAWDAFVIGDTVYDISMGFPFEEYLSYFLPQKLSIKEKILTEFLIRTSIDRSQWKLPSGIASAIRSLPKAEMSSIEDAARRRDHFSDSLYAKVKPRPRSDAEKLFEAGGPMAPFLSTFRCRHPLQDHVSLGWDGLTTEGKRAILYPCVCW
jgi:hypothetical protein